MSYRSPFQSTRLSRFFTKDRSSGIGQADSNRMDRINRMKKRKYMSATLPVFYPVYPVHPC
jgi:hypothetical protein